MSRCIGWLMFGGLKGLRLGWRSRSEHVNESPEDHFHLPAAVCGVRAGWRMPDASTNCNDGVEMAVRLWTTGVADPRLRVPLVLRIVITPLLVVCRFGLAARSETRVRTVSSDNLAGCW